VLSSLAGRRAADHDQHACLLRALPPAQDFCNRLHKTLIKQFKYALVWGSSVKHRPQKVGGAAAGGRPRARRGAWLRDWQTNANRAVFDDCRWARTTCCRTKTSCSWSRRFDLPTCVL
jgi:hypothetical protein